jgi:hypothetical protein
LEGVGATVMVEVDRTLVDLARHFITAANVHRVTQMIFVYEQAVALHNEGYDGHQVYQERFKLNCV